MNEYLELLGKKATDKITGFSGIVESISFDLYGCVQAVIRPGTDEKGKPQEGCWFDVKRLTVTGQAIMAPPVYKKLGREIGAAPKPYRP